MASRRKARPTSESPTPDAGRYPHELRAGDVVIDEHGDAWELLGRPTKVVGAQEFVATIRRVDSPVDTREARWRAHERVKVRRA